MITREKFIESTGFEPSQDDLERCNCKESGPGHLSCGWCDVCDLPRFMCKCSNTFDLHLDSIQLKDGDITCIDDYQPDQLFLDPIFDNSLDIPACALSVSYKQRRITFHVNRIIVPENSADSFKEFIEGIHEVIYDLDPKMGEQLYYNILKSIRYLLKKAIAEGYLFKLDTSRCYREERWL